MYSVKILADSLAPSGKRLTTFELVYPRFIHSEILTHRMFSRNSASSRAIPVKKIIDQVHNNPAMPISWGRNQPGMQATLTFNDDDIEQWAIPYWNRASSYAVEVATMFNDQGVHKQITNRLLEPFMWMTTILSATEFDNFFKLRCDQAAQPELQHLAKMMREQYEEHKPYVAEGRFWHLPLINFEDFSALYAGPKNVEELEDVAKKVSVGRCARVSYLTHDGKRDIQKDIELHDRLWRDGHLSPFEHCAMALDKPERHANFIGWKSYRQFLEET